MPICINCQTAVSGAWCCDVCHEKLQQLTATDAEHLASVMRQLEHLNEELADAQRVIVSLTEQLARA